MTAPLTKGLNMADIIAFITTNSVDLLMLLGSLLGVFSIIAKLTPTDADDKILAVVLKVVHTLGLTKK
jgi:hypothetical protein